MGYNTDDPVKRECYRIYNRARKRGELIRQPCMVCSDPKADGHHEDHTKPLEVQWLCRKHHTSIGKKNIEGMRKGGRLGGQKRKEMGLESLWHKGGKAWGQIQGPRNVASGLLAQICSQGGKVATHIRWHVNRGLVSEKCELCTQIGYDRTQNGYYRIN